MEREMKMSKEEIEKARKLASWTARKHDHKVGLISADRADLEQEAWVAILEARERETQECWSYRGQWAEGAVKNYVNRKCQVVSRVMDSESKPVLVDVSDTSRMDAIWAKMSRSQKAEMIEKGGSMVQPGIDPMDIDRKRVVEKLMRVLNAQEREVVARRWFGEDSFQKIANEMGLRNKAQACDIEKKALRKMIEQAQLEAVDAVYDGSDGDGISGGTEANLFGDADGQDIYASLR